MNIHDVNAEVAPDQLDSIWTCLLHSTTPVREGDNFLFIYSGERSEMFSHCYILSWRYYLIMYWILAWIVRGLSVWQPWAGSTKISLLIRCKVSFNGSAPPELNPQLSWLFSVPLNISSLVPWCLLFLPAYGMVSQSHQLSLTATGSRPGATVITTHYVVVPLLPSLSHNRSMNDASSHRFHLHIKAYI